MARQKSSKLQRSEVVTMRLDPKLRYLVELAARTQRRTVSSFLEWAAERAVMTCVIDHTFHNTSEGKIESSEVPLAAEAEVLWDVDEPDRLAKLAMRHPTLLTYNEQVIWKRICEDRSIWRADEANKAEGLDLQLMRSRWLSYVAGLNEAEE